VVKVGIETERGPWVQALVAAGYEVFPVNPVSVARYRERHSTSGAKSDAGDAHVLAEIVRLDRAHHRPVAGDSPQAEAVKLVARAHQTLIWDRTRQVLRLRAALREFFPAALEAFADLDAPDALELLGRVPGPDQAAALSRAKIAAALGRANRRDATTRAAQIQAVLRAPQLRPPAPVQAAYAAIVSGQVRLIAALNTQIDELGEVVASNFGRHRDADIYVSQPGLGTILSARIMAEFGDDPYRFADARARKNYAGMAPITRASGRKKVVLARYARNRRLADALHQWAFCAMRGSPGARSYCQALRDRGIGLYGHVSKGMRDELKTALQKRWTDSLRGREALSSRSSVSALDALLVDLGARSAPVKIRSQTAPNNGHPTSQISGAKFSLSR
jgi:transposase